MEQHPLPPERAPTTLQRWEHTAFDGTPYYDEDLKVGQSRAHRIMVLEVASILASIAREAGLVFLSDEPIWYIDPVSDAQKVFYGDLVIARGGTDQMRVTADDLLLVIEVVSTNYRKKEIKDTGFQRTLNEYNSVPELALLFPEASDSRSLRWCRLVDGLYEELNLSPGAEVASSTVGGLLFRVRPQSEWEDGRKVELFYKGERRLDLDEERERAEQERARAERLAERLREMGVEPPE
jgi:Uma2 family endonuclease